MKTIYALFALSFLLFPSIAAADTDDPCWNDPEIPCIFIGFDPKEVSAGEISESFLPLLDHYFRVVAVFPLTSFEMEGEFTDCFIQIEMQSEEELYREYGMSVPLDGQGRPYVQDFDNSFVPMNRIAIDTETCTSPLEMTNKERDQA